MKRYLLVLFLFLSFSGYSQNTINNYKYVVVPEKFDFLKQNDQYLLNSLAKALLAHKGFTAYFDNNELPREMANNKCGTLIADVVERKTMFVTRLTLLLKDCQGNIIFKSKEGKSREKEYKVAYSVALRDAFTSLDSVSYTYVESTIQPAQSTITTTPSTLRAKSTEVLTDQPAQPAITTASSTAPLKSTEVLINQPAQQTITKTASTVPVKSTEVAPNQPAGTLYAQPITNGYQLIDTTPKIVLTLLKTSAENYFIASNATANGIVLKRNEEWLFEYYKDGRLISEKLLVKF